MSWLSEFLKKEGVPASLLDKAQVIIDGYKDRLVEQIPTTDAICASIRRQDPYKKALALVPAASRAHVDGMLPVIVDCALVKIRKVLNI